MGKKRETKMIDDVFEECVSANECTGLFQRVALDPDEVALFHKMYNEVDIKDKKK